jgi:hypothetical protein
MGDAYCALGVQQLKLLGVIAQLFENLLGLGAELLRR